MKILVLTLLITYWLFGFLWWKQNIHKKVTGSNNNEIWESIALFAALFGGIFIFLYDYKRNKH
jgi:hypothetical protein